MKKRCKNKKCSCLFKVSFRNKNQEYCCKDECQKARKAERQRRKMAEDEEYRKGQEDCRAKWKKQNRGYWKKYRKKNLKYTEQNRQKQKVRDLAKRASKTEKPILQDLAKMHPLMHENQTISGIYKLIPVQENNLAKMHPLYIEITEISESYSYVT